MLYVVCGLFVRSFTMDSFKSQHPFLAKVGSIFTPSSLRTEGISGKRHLNWRITYTTQAGWTRLNCIRTPGHGGVVTVKCINGVLKRVCLMDYEKLNVIVGTDKQPVVYAVNKRVPSEKFFRNYMQRRAKPSYMGPNSLDVDV